MKVNPKVAVVCAAISLIGAVLLVISIFQSAA